MASEQIGAKKKLSRNSVKVESIPVLYRHQDCNPDNHLLTKCGNQGLLNPKNNKDLLKNNESVNKTKITRAETSSKNNHFETSKKLTKDLEQERLKSDLLNEKNEELSKSRKRRLRKRRLLTSLIPNSGDSKQTAIEQAKLAPEKLAQPKTSDSSHKLITKSSDESKTINKDSRKKTDKSVGLRSKSVKNKALAELIQDRANLIKTLEEKTLNSILQTLVPLTKSPPLNQTPPSQTFSFPERKLNKSDTNTNKDDVFYFGETKHQLENFASAGVKSSDLQPIRGQQPFPSKNTKSIENSFSINSGNHCVPSFSFSNSGFTSNSILDSPTEALRHITDKKVVSSSSLENEPTCSFKVLNESNSNRSFNSVGEINRDNRCFAFSSITVNNLDIKSKTVENSNGYTIEKPISKVDTESSSSNLSTSIPDNTTKVNKLIEDIKNNQNIMKPTEENSKSNKTREEILLEREAKKAAKLAAKTKSKCSDPNKVVSSDNNPGKLQNKSLDADTRTTAIDNDPKSQTKNSESFKDKSLTIDSKISQVSDSSHTSIEIKQTNQESTGKSKAEIKAERRAKQEAQRAAKAAGKTAQPQKKEKTLIEPKVATPASKSSNVEQKVEVQSAPVAKLSTQPKPKLFSHLYQEKVSLTSKQVLSNESLHPAIVRLGVQYQTRVVVGSNARCVALMHALKQMVNDYTTPTEKEFARGLEEELKPVTAYLHNCRPLAVSMTNALRHIKRALTQLPNTISDLEARRKICDVIDTYIHEQIDVAGKAICNRVLEKISDGDVILTYGCSSLVYQILVESHMQGTKFKVVVVDGLPWREGKEMLRRLVDKGLSCTYVLITAASFIMREASKVLLGAHALLANGYVMSRAGSSQVALLAHCNNVPVLVCCETHKFCERVQTDAFVYNELGDLCCDNIKDKEKGRLSERLTPLSLAYDITPPDLVSAVVTELAVLPCTSVPVILRIKPSESVV